MRRMPGPHRRRDRRPRRAPRVRAHAPDARAAHPPREGDLEHHDEPDPARARRPRDALVARAGGAARGGGGVPRARAVRAGARPARAGVRGRSVQGGRVPDADPRRARSSATRASAACTPGTRSGATTRGWTTCSSSRSPRGAPSRTSTASRMCSRRCAGDRSRQRVAGRTARLRALAARPPRGTPAAAGPPRPELPESLRRSRPPRLPELSEPELVRHFTTLADRTFGVDTGFYPLGSCTMKHNPRVHERLAGLPGFRDLHPHQEDEAAQGALELMFRLQEMLAEIAGLPAVTLQPAAGLAGRAHRADAHARVLRRPGRGARHDHHPGHRPRHEPRERDDGGLQAREDRDRRAREPRPRRPAREGERADGGAHAHEPVHARALRRGDRGGRADLPRRGRAPLLRRREPERRRRHLAPRRHGLRHRPLQPAQDVLAAARRRRPRRRPGRGAGHDRAVPPEPDCRSRRRHVPARPRPAEVDRARARVRRPVRRLRARVRVHARVRPRPEGDVRGRRC